jgi:hypothetical protein
VSTTTCPDCGVTYGFGASPFCSHGHGAYSAVKQPAVTYPGGLTLYNFGSPTPTTVYSETERKALMKERGLREAVYHIPSPDSDQSPVTRSWDMPNLENARILLERGSQPKDDAGKLETLRLDWQRGVGGFTPAPEVG